MVSLANVKKTLVILVVLSGGLVLSPRSGSALSYLPPPRIVPDIGAVKASWASVPGATSYEISTIRDSKLCVTVQLECRIKLPDALPVRFRLTAILPQGTLLSAWSYTTTPRLLVIVAGQSNAFGAESYVVDPLSNVNYFQPPYSGTADSKSKLVWIPWWTQPAPTNLWQPLSAPQFNKDDVGRRAQIFGPEIGLARQIWKDSHTPLWIIKATFPGGSLAEQWGVTSALYSTLIKEVKNRMLVDAKKGSVDVLGALYWYQGETDAFTTSFALSYETNFRLLLKGFENDLPFSPFKVFVITKPSIAAWIDNYQETHSCTFCDQLRTNDSMVRGAIDAVTSQRPDTLVVDSLGLERMTTKLHLSNRAELQLGVALAQASEVSLRLQKK